MCDKWYRSFHLRSLRVGIFGRERHFFMVHVKSMPCEEFNSSAYQSATAEEGEEDSMSLDVALKALQNFPPGTLHVLRPLEWTVVTGML